MEDPVGNLHLQAVDSAGDVGIDQFRFINKGFKVGFYRLIDIGQVFLDRTDQILGTQVGSRDDGNCGFQFFIQVLFIAGGSAAQIPDRYKGKTDTQNFDKDIYGSTITVNLYKKLREVRKFNELSLLLAQIANDRTMALKFWGLKQASHTLHIDVNRHCVILEQKEVYLSTNEFEVLYLLQQSPQTTFTKEQIYEKIWHEPTNNHLHAVENTIFQIRKRLKPYCKGREYIKTVIGYGYKFNSG